MSELERAALAWYNAKADFLSLFEMQDAEDTEWTAEQYAAKLKFVEAEVRLMLACQMAEKESEQSQSFSMAR